MEINKALLVVDVQNDFCPGGALAVPQGDAVVPVLNKYIADFRAHGFFVFASRDWHPEVTKHFKKYGGPWPVHCVENTRGAEFYPHLELTEQDVIISKGMDAEKDSYSAFQGEDRQGISFLDILNDLGIQELFVGGLATDYCVKSSCCDALRCGFKVYLLTDAIGGVDIQPDDSQKAIEEMISQGALRITHDQLTDHLH